MPRPMMRWMLVVPSKMAKSSDVDTRDKDTRSLSTLRTAGPRPGIIVSETG